MSTPNFGKIEAGFPMAYSGKICFIRGFEDGSPSCFDPHNTRKPILAPLSKRWWIHRTEKISDGDSPHGGRYRKWEITLIDNHAQGYSYECNNICSPYASDFTRPVFYIKEDDTYYSEPLADEVITAIKQGRSIADAKKDKEIKDRDLAQQAQIARLKAELLAVRAQAEAEVASARAEAEAEVAKARAEAEAELTAFRAQAEAEVAKIRSDAEAQIASIRAESIFTPLVKWGKTILA